MNLIGESIQSFDLIEHQEGFKF